jgi:hypothetical protein
LDLPATSPLFRCFISVWFSGVSVLSCYLPTIHAHLCGFFLTGQIVVPTK